MAAPVSGHSDLAGVWSLGVGGAPLQENRRTWRRREKELSPLDDHCWSRDSSSGRGLTQIYNKGYIFSLYKSLFNGNYVFHVITETLQSSGPPTVTFGLIY